MLSAVYEWELEGKEKAFRKFSDFPSKSKENISSLDSFRLNQSFRCPQSPLRFLATLVRAYEELAETSIGKSA